MSRRNALLPVRLIRYEKKNNEISLFWLLRQGLIGLERNLSTRKAEWHLVSRKLSNQDRRLEYRDLARMAASARFGS
jgi:hypothetical protein